MTTLKNSTGGRRRYGDGGKRTRFDILADVSAAFADGKELFDFGHSVFDLRDSVWEVKKRRSKLLRRSLLRKPGENPPIKLSIKRWKSVPIQQPPVSVADGVSVSPPSPAAVASVSVPLRQIPPPAAVIPPPTVSPAAETPRIRLVIRLPTPISDSPREKEELHRSKKARVSASGKGASVFPFPPAVVSPVSQKPPPAIAPPSAASSSPRRSRLAAPLPIDPQQEEDLPLSVKARVSAAVGGEQVCSLESKFTLVIKKKLTRSDLKTDQCRISIPGLQIEKKFLELLTTHEKTAVQTGENIKLAFFLDPDFQVAGEHCSFGKWKMTKSEFYKVNGSGWRWVLDRVEKGMLSMSVGDQIEIWSFRTGNSGELCFLLVNATADARRRRILMEHKSPMASTSSKISTITDHQEEEEEEVRPVVDTSLRL